MIEAADWLLMVVSFLGSKKPTSSCGAQAVTAGTIKSRVN
jgi:hypothetical protein